MEKRFYKEQRETHRPSAGRMKRVVELNDAQCEVLVAQLLGDDAELAAVARDRIILGCLPMVARIADLFRGYERRGVERGDIVGAGNHALVEAVDSMRALPLPTLKTWLANRVRDKMNLAVRQYLNMVSVPKNRGNDCLVDVERYEDYDDGEIQRLFLRTSEEEADRQLISSSAREQLFRLLERELPHDELTVVHGMFLTEPALTTREIARRTDIHPHKVWALKDRAIRRLRSIPQGGRIVALLHECLSDDVWENTSDAC